mgnify:CR=1 FL=1
MYRCGMGAGMGLGHPGHCMPHHWVPKQEMADHETIVLDVIQYLTETGHDILGQYLYRGVAQWYCRGRASPHPLVWPPDRTVTTGEVF